MERIVVKVVLVTALMLGAVSSSAAPPAPCDMQALAGTQVGRELPDVATRDAIFACAGIVRFIPARYDELDRDLLFGKATYLGFDEYAGRYPGFPKPALHKLWELVREFKGAQRR